MNKNVATKIALFAFDTTSGSAKVGDAANITAYVAKDYGTTTVLADTSATEQDSTNAKGWYLFDVAQAETNADALLFTGKSSTANIAVVGQYIFTTPNRFSSLVIDSSGLADTNMVKAGPSGSGTAQTARDIGASVLLSAGTGTGQLDFTSGVVKSSLSQILGTALTETSGQLAAAFKKFFNIATPASTMDALTLVATATNLTNAPTSGDLTAAMKTSVTTAATAATPIAASVTGAVGSVTGLTASDVAAIKAKTDNLPSDPADESLVIAATDAIMSRIGIAGVGLTNLGDTRIAHLDADVSSVGGGSLTVPDIVNGVLDELTSGHQTSGTVGKAITDAQSAGDPMAGTAESGFTYGDVLRLLAAVAMGKDTIVKTGSGTATVTFRSIDDSADRVIGQMNGSQRAVMTLNP